MSMIAYDCRHFATKDILRKGPQKCTIVDDCAHIAESGLNPPFENPFRLSRYRSHLGPSGPKSIKMVLDELLFDFFVADQSFTTIRPEIITQMIHKQFFRATDVRAIGKLIPTQ